MNKKRILFVFAILLAVLFTYYKTLFTFYQQDEWGTFGHVLTAGWWSFFSGFSNPVLVFITGGERPLAIPIQFIFYRFFPLQIAPFALFGFFFQFINSIMLFLVTKKISKSLFLSVLSTFFFVTASASQQAVIWAAASTQTLPAAFFVFLAIYLYLLFHEQNKQKFLYLSLLAGIIAYLFKETSVIIFVFLPLVDLLLRKAKNTWVLYIKRNIVFFLPLLYVVFVRAIDVLITPKQTNFFLIHNSPTFSKIILHVLLYPIESVSQLFVPDSIMFPLASHFVKLLYERLAYYPILQIASETIAADMISFIISTFLISILGIIYLLDRQKRKIILFGLTFTLLSFVPFVLIAKGDAYLESRYFSLGVAGGAILFGIFFESISGLINKKLHISKKISILLLGFIAVLYFSYQVSLIHQSLQVQVNTANERKKLLNTMLIMYPSIKNNQIIYITGNSDFYVGNNKVPFQQGMGFTLMVLYYRDRVIPKELINNNYLWDLTSQGYKEINQKGFGYYWDIEKLKRDLKERKMDKNNIIGLYYDANRKTLTDISSKVRKEF